MDAEVEMYLNEILSLNWKLAQEYTKPENQRIKPTIDKYWARLNSAKYKIAKRINCLKREIDILKINQNYNE